MKISMDILVAGLTKYIDADILPALPTTQRWVATAAALAGLARLPGLPTRLPVLKTLGLIDEDGNIDIDTAYSAAKQACQRQGALSITIPLMGTMSFGEKNFDKLYKLIMAEAPQSTSDESDREEDE